MDLAYNENRYHDFEISKDISLRQISARALLALRESGSTGEFDLPEALFDLDFPGHYRRRIKGIAVSIHCLAGPYTSMNATLSLINHRQRIKDTTDKDYMSGQGVSDDRFSSNEIIALIKDVAISTGQVDIGVFELNFGSNNYQPFEGAGAVSTWFLEMPKDYRQFDYETISDVVLHLRYTSKRGSTTQFRDHAIAGLSTYVKQATDLSSKFGLHMLINIRSDYPDGWVPFAIPLTADDADAQTSIRYVSLTRLRDHLPFFARSMDLTVTGVTIYIGFSGVQPSKLFVLPSQMVTIADARKLLAETPKNALELSAQDKEDKAVIFQWRSDMPVPENPEPTWETRAGSICAYSAATLVIENELGKGAELIEFGSVLQCGRSWAWAAGYGSVGI